jgi:TRAP-type C4-dicarboxylate transport system substrate-binding protein
MQVFPAPPLPWPRLSDVTTRYHDNHQSMIQHLVVLMNIMDYSSNTTERRKALLEMAVTFAVNTHLLKHYNDLMSEVIKKLEGPGVVITTFDKDADLLNTLRSLVAAF